MAVLLLAAGAWRLTRDHEVRRDPGLSVLLITVDTLRADAVGAYGSARPSTPWMDRLAARGVRFERVWAHNPVTLPSHASILSGRYPLAHGVRDNSGFRFPSELATMAALLKARGYRTGAFVSAFPLDSQFGLDRGFETYEDSFVNVDTQSAVVLQERPGTRTVALAQRWLEAQGEDRYFCWVHLFEPHFPYRPPEPFASRFRDDPYLGEVAAADAALGPLLAPLLEAGVEGRSLVVLTSDHGESLGEHGEATHGIFAYESTLRVPLVLFGPSILAPRVVSEPARHVDLLPTVLDALAAPSPEGLPGRSLLSLAANAPTRPHTSYFEALSGWLNRGWAPLRGVVRGRMKYIDLPIPELYDLEADPEEETNLAAARPALTEEMRAALVELLSPERGIERRQEDPDTRERLRSLGYVTAGAPGSGRRFTEEDDPKLLIGLDGMLHEVTRLRAAGDLAGSLRLCQELVRRRPSMPLSLVRLAALHRDNGNLGAAVEALRKALELTPEDPDTLALMGAYLSEAGRAQEAVDLLEAHTERSEPALDVLTARGMALAHLGRFAEALQTFAAAQELDPSNAMALVNVATVYLMAQDLPRARGALERALAMNPGLARAHNSLGVIAARSGRPEEAIDHWRRAVEIEPREFDTLFNLGMLLLRRGRPAEARAYLERFVQSAPAAAYAQDIARIRDWLRGGHTLQPAPSP